MIDMRHVAFVCLDDDLINNTFVCPRSAKIAAGAVVCVESEVRGDVTIGEADFITTFQKKKKKK